MMIDSKKLLEAATPFFEIILKEKESDFLLEEYLTFTFEFQLKKEKDGSFSVANPCLFK